MSANKAKWTNVRHASQWRETIENYANPVLGDLPVSSVDTGLVTRVLEGLWQEKPETGSRLRGRVEAVLDFARVRGWREGENPARWRGHLQLLLPAPTAAKQAVRRAAGRAEHFASMPYDEIPGFLSRLRAVGGIPARALEFQILTAARPGEAIGARWDEIDLERRLWTVPPERMKSGREHRVPLSEPALAILRAMAEVRCNDFVFPGLHRNRPITPPRGVLTRLGCTATLHGFRATFRSWASERTAFPHEVCELALGHLVADPVLRAYQRSDLVERRRSLAEAWAMYLSVPAPQHGGEVVDLGDRRRG